MTSKATEEVWSGLRWDSEAWEKGHAIAIMERHGDMRPRCTERRINVTHPEFEIRCTLRDNGDLLGSGCVLQRLSSRTRKGHASDKDVVNHSPTGINKNRRSKNDTSVRFRLPQSKDDLKVSYSPRLQRRRTSQVQEVFTVLAMCS
jgi:hypothetical protein